jgi:hypothetical protein
MTEKELLRGTLERLRSGGWVPRSGISGTAGPHCVITAMGTEFGAQVGMSIPEFVRLIDANPAYRAAKRRLNRLAREAGSPAGIVPWNDMQKDFASVEQMLLGALAGIEVEEVTARAAAAAQQPEPAYA